jgi:hypothetical protein
LQHFQLENALTLTVPRIGGFDLDPATIQVSTSMVRTKSGSDSTVNPEIIITGVIFYPTRIER